jgi:hypothetical protein
MHANRALVAAGAATLLIAALMPGAVSADAPYQVVADGLHSPRGLTFGPGDRLYVAEAGSGSTAQDPIGHDGAIREIVGPASAQPTLRTVISGLPSIGGGGEILGVDGLSAMGNGSIYAIMAESAPAIGDPAFGTLIKVSTGGQMRTVADVGGPNYDWTGSVVGNPVYDPGGQYPDSNPYGVLALPGHTYVVDAGANTLNEVMPNGRVRILAFFPNIDFGVPFPPFETKTDATPTCVAQGPDGMLYVGTLSLVPSFFGGPTAKVYRVDPSRVGQGGEVTVLGPSDEWATGLWPINGCAFGPDGSFYASELFTSVSFGPDGPVPAGGDVVKIPFTTPATHVSLTGGTLPLAGGVAVARDGTVYAVGGTAFAPTGFVARLTSH